MKNNEVLNLQIGYNIDSYTNQKYYILYVILKPAFSAIKLNFFSEELINEDTYKLTLGFNNLDDNIALFINKKYYNKEFTFFKKRINKKTPNYIIRISNNPRILLVDNNKDLVSQYFYIDI